MITNNHLITLAIATLVTVSIFVYFNKDSLTLGALPVIQSKQLAASPSNGDCLTTDGTNNSWDTCATGGGSVGGTWSTTTSQVSGQLINYPNNDDDIVTIGSNSTTTAEFYYDPNTQSLFALVASSTFVGNSTTTGTIGVGSVFVSDDYISDFNGDGLTVSGGALAFNCGDVNGNGLTCSSNNLVVTLGTSISVGEMATADFGDWSCNGSACTVDSGVITTDDISDATILGADINKDGAWSDNDIIVYNSAGDDFTGLTCAEITGSADLCDGTDATGSGIDGFDFSYEQDIGFGLTGSATSTKTQFTAGVHASGTSQFSNASTTLATIVTGWFTDIFIGTDTLAEYISDTAGAFFTGNTETGITVTYQDADNTVDVVCDTASGSVFGCLSSTDWTTFNSKQATISATWPITLSGATLSWSGLATTSNPTAGNLFYSNGTTGLVPVATSSITFNSPITTAGTAGFIVGGSGFTLDVDDIGAADLANADFGSFSCNGTTCTIDTGAVSNTMLANSTISGIALGSNLANLTATNSTLTFSGTYNGSTARTVGVNLGHDFTWTGVHDFGAAVIEMTNGTGPTVDAIGEFAFDTTSNQKGQFLIATSTDASWPAVFNVEQKIWGRTIASTSIDFLSGGRIPFPPLNEGWTITKILCVVDGGTSVVVNVDTLAGGANTTSATCATTKTTQAVTANQTLASTTPYVLEFGTVTGSVDYVSVSVYGTPTRE